MGPNSPPQNCLDLHSPAPHSPAPLLFLLLHPAAQSQGCRTVSPITSNVTPRRKRWNYFQMLEKHLPLPARSNKGSTLQPLRSERLRFLQLDEWDEHNSYDEEVPTCLHYSIEWKVSVNNTVISRDTKQDLVLAPTSPNLRKWEGGLEQICSMR